jgi:hypothetical protein
MTRGQSVHASDSAPTALSLEQTLSDTTRDALAAARSRMPSLKTLLQAHPKALEQIEVALGRTRRRQAGVGHEEGDDSCQQRRRTAGRPLTETTLRVRACEKWPV